MDFSKINWLICNKFYLKRGWLLFLVLSISGLHVRGFLQDQYIGCFAYISKTTLYSGNKDSQDNQLAINKCILKCKRQVQLLQTYSALQNGTICHCVDDFDDQLPDDACNVTCAGNQSQYCGGTTTIGNNMSSIRLAFVVYAVCPVGSYGSYCEKFCHCKRQIPCDRMTGYCPDGCDGNYSPTGRWCNETMLSERYIGCYRDRQESRALPHRPYAYSARNTLELCRASCADTNYSYAGAQFSNECHCGETSNKYKKLEESMCNTSCSGNRNTFCGGANANSIYSVCPFGRYGKGCRKRCNCLDNKRCVYLNGSCPLSECKPGWTGNSCNIRDCRASNGDCLQNEKCSTVDLKFSNLSVCRCSEGFRKRKIWEDCTGYSDKDECSEIPSVCGQIALNCTNTIGGYQCLCPSGETRLSRSCMTENENAQKMAIVGAVLGSLLCLTAILVIIVLLYKHRDKWQSLRFKQHSYQRPRDSATDNICSQEIELETGEQNTVYYSSSSVPREIIVQQLPHMLRQKISTPGILDKEFKRVPMETKQPYNVGKNREFKKKNRFKNIVPYDHNRVILRKLDGNALSDYVNASYIKGYNATDRFIATQGPRPETVGDFWRMVWEKEANVIVMITDLVENRKVKCEKYWPNIGECVEFEGIAIKTTKEEYWNDFVSRQIQITKNSQTLTIKQWHFLSWPDHGIPLDVNSFRNFHRRVRQCMEAGKHTIVHCSAGAGRTGCFIGVDFLIEQGNSEGKVDVSGCLQSLRDQRSQMIQTLDQYKFVHTVLLKHYSIGDTAIPRGIFHQKLRELQQKNVENGRCKMDVQYNSLGETKEKLAGTNSAIVAMKSIEKNKVVEMDVAFVNGWKKRNAYVTLKFPAPTAAQDFYSLCRENRCNFVIILDSVQASIAPVFPTKGNDISLRSHVVSCDRISTADYGTRFKLFERRRSDETYANLQHLDIYANVGGEPDTREMHVFHLTKALTRDAIDPHNLIALCKDICELTTRGNDGSTIVFSRSGYSLTAFCLASFIAFDMIKDENEVDVYQIVQDIRKSKAQLEFSLTMYKALHETVAQYIDQTI